MESAFTMLYGRRTGEPTFATPSTLELDRRRFIEKAELARAVDAIDDSRLISLKVVVEFRNEFGP